MTMSPILGGLFLDGSCAFSSLTNFIINSSS
jgi:hypothetical protein